MRTVFVLFDSLVRNALGCYGGNWIKTPNFDRLAARGVTFDNHYVGSLPCMPARRDLHTGRLNFMHRSWGPLEPFDNSFPALLRAGGVYTHLVSDHCHYFEDGGWSYHPRYSSFEFIRGQETDKWKAMVNPPIERFKEIYDHRQYDFDGGENRWITHAVNREYMKQESDFPCVKCFDAGFEFLDTNRQEDDWFLQIECFDPHEPFFAPERFRTEYSKGYNGPILDWPRYGAVIEDEATKHEIKANYASLVAMCDDYFGRLLDYFDRHNMWDDTALILTTDHGFLLSEHDWWGKNLMPYYDEVAKIPLLIHHPDHAASAGQRRTGLTQTMDLMPTILEIFGQTPPEEVRAKSVLPLLAADANHRDAVIFGMFGAAMNVTDGRYTYFLYPDDLDAQQIFEYTVMPTHMIGHFGTAEFAGATLAGPFDFTKGIQIMRLPARAGNAHRPPGQDAQSYQDASTRLFDTQTDPDQNHPIDDPAVVQRLQQHIISILQQHDAPLEAYSRIGLTPTPAAA